MLKANGRTLRANYFRRTAQSERGRTTHLYLVPFSRYAAQFVTGGLFLFFAFLRAMRY